MSYIGKSQSVWSGYLKIFWSLRVVILRAGADRENASIQKTHNSRIAWAFETSEPIPWHNVSNQATPPHPSQTVHLLGTKYSNIWACGGWSHSNYHKWPVKCVRSLEPVCPAVYTRVCIYVHRLVSYMFIYRVEARGQHWVSSSLNIFRQFPYWTWSLFICWLDSELCSPCLHVPSTGITNYYSWLLCEV